MSASETIERLERDPLGTVAVPPLAYYGPQTARAIGNFPISGIPIGHFPDLIRALALVKAAAAKANIRLGSIDVPIGEAICAACDDVASGRLDREFPLDVFQGGAGTSTNMNVNEVVANRALELLGLPRGRYDVVHPNDHVNHSQSTNDVYPTAIRVAILFAQRRLASAVGDLADAFEAKGFEFSGILKLGRTQLQDAVPMTLGQEFRAFAATLREDVCRMRELSSFLNEINLGGTAIGTGINADAEYGPLAVGELARLTGLPLRPADDLIEACWDTGAFVLFSGMLKRTATKLSKICNDMRLLSSGPRGGLNEINLPALQPGSSIMPGKVNPVIPEVVNQVAFQVVGADLTITMAAEAGQLQLNVMEPVITYNILQSLSLMTNAVTALNIKCVAGITANEVQCRAHLEASTAVATALAPVIGYARAAELAKQVLREGTTIRSVLAADPDLSPELIAMTADLNQLVGPASMKSRARAVIHLDKAAHLALAAAVREGLAKVVEADIGFGTSP